jgi:uncharacterized protein with HEPN domain
MRGYEILGEAVPYLPEWLKAANPDRWTTLAAVRNSIVHGIDDSILFATIEQAPETVAAAPRGVGARVHGVTP